MRVGWERENDRKRGMVGKRKIGRETGMEETGMEETGVEEREKENHREGEGETGVRQGRHEWLKERKTTGMGEIKDG